MVLVLTAILAAVVALCALTIHRSMVAMRWKKLLVGHLHYLEQLGAQIMTANERIQAVLTRIDAATNNIAADLRKLKDQITNGTPTEEVLTGLESAAVALEGVAASTEDPVPGDGGGPATED